MCLLRWILAIALASFAAPALAADCATLAGNLVANCGFETGDFNGWTQGGNTDFAGVTSGTFNGADPTQGSFQAFFGSVTDPGSLSQTLTTAPGTWYTLSFDLALSAGQGDRTSPRDGATVSAQVLWDGDSVLFTTNPAAFNYTPHTIQVQGTGSDLLTFQFRNDPSYFELDNIGLAVTAAVTSPEPSSLAILSVALGLLAAPRRPFFKRRAARSAA